jgi:prophage regulatory protein
MQKDQNSLLRFKQIKEIIPMCKVTWYKLVREGRVPKPVKIGRASYWRYKDILSFVDSLEAGI